MLLWLILVFKFRNLSAHQWETNEILLNLNFIIRGYNMLVELSIIGIKKIITYQFACYVFDEGQGKERTQDGSLQYPDSIVIADDFKPSNCTGLIPKLSILSRSKQGVKLLNAFKKSRRSTLTSSKFAAMNSLIH